MDWVKSVSGMPWGRAECVRPSISSLDQPADASQAHGCPPARGGAFVARLTFALAVLGLLWHHPHLKKGDLFRLVHAGVWQQRQASDFWS